MEKEFKVEISEKSRKCYNCDSEIPKGEACITFYSYHVRANLCRVCIINMQEEIYQANIDYIIRKGTK